MRVIIVGSGGQLGSALATAVPGATALSRTELDITDADAVAAFDWSGHDTVLNAAAYTAVDAAETPEGRVAAWRVNAVGPANLARAARDHDLRLVHVSSEYVFDGAHDGPIPETAPLSPLSVYGASKAAGDIAVTLAPRHHLVRTTWVVGAGGNFVRTMLGLAGRGVSPAVVADQIGRPTFATDLAAGILALLDADAEPGTYNVTNTGEPASWADVARAVYAHAGRPESDVRDTSTTEYFADKPAAAARPSNSVLDLDKAAKAGVVLPDWRRSLAGYLAAG
ncbi:MAG: NAD(P)-dependent oxidoreductase [Pseudonocardia sp.]|nr:NAD(P)-dependent oxidoreductase [Pseudonocardia sp.]